MEIQKLPSYPERRLHFLHLPRQTGTFPTLSLPDIPTVTATSQGSDTDTGTASATQDTQSGDTQSQPSQSASTPAPTSNPPSGSSSNVQSATDSSSESASPSATPSPTPTPTPTPTTSDTTSTPQSSSSSDTPTPSSSSPTPTPTPTPTSTSSPSPTTTDPASSSSPSSTSGVSLTTFTSSFVSEINGTPTTIVTPIVTALNTSQPHSAAASRRTGIIAGSAIGGATLLILALAALFYVRRRATKQTQRYAALARKPPPSRAAFLAGEDMDGPSAARYGDGPSSARYGDGGWDGGRYGDGGDGGRYELPPRLFHASESGSVFQEAVWPPPIPLADPLRSASGADLARIVDDVMGPPTRLRGGSWDADQSYDSLALLQAERAQDRSYDSLAMRVGPQHEHAHARDTSVSSQTGLLPGFTPPPGGGVARSPLALTLANPDAAGPATPPASAKPWLDRAPEPKHSPHSVGQAL